jgi:hypothetical protein
LLILHRHKDSRKVKKLAKALLLKSGILE